VNVLQILTYPDERLKRETTKVEYFDFTLRDRAIRMYKTMIANHGAGLAAPQVGIPQSFFVIQHGLMEHNIIVNPEWQPAEDSKQYEAEEGCLSFPGLFVKVNRYDKINVQYQYVDGKVYTDTLDGFAAHVFQHESDHLVGTLMIDHLVI
jgi:peptide deformylase